MLAGGSEAAITPLAIAGFMSMRALCEGEDKTRASIPFDRNVMASSWAKAPASWCWRNMRTPRRAAPISTAR